MSLKLTPYFNLGAASAEHDPYLLEAYVDNGAYAIIKSRTNPKCFIIGRTGTGKSALLKLLENDYPDKVIRIEPENLALTYITNLQVMPTLIDLGVHLEPFLKALWKHVFIVEILRHRYKLFAPEQKDSLIAGWIKSFVRDPAKVEAIRYLNDFGDKFWCETDERVRQIAYTFEQKFAAAGGAKAAALGAGGNLSSSKEHAEREEERIELASRYQRIVNEVQIPRFNKMMELLNTEILDSQHFTYVVIDDLDKDWVDEKFANLLIRCLFQAVEDMKKISNCRILVALRTNIFEQLDYGESRRGNQEEKLRDLTLPLRWEWQELKRLLGRRVEVASKAQKIDPPLSLDALLPQTSRRVVDPIAYIFARTLLRPRDAILFLNSYLQEVIDHDSITMENVYRAEKRYSEERLIALRDEWKDPYLGIEKVVEVFRRSPSRLSRADLTLILDEVPYLLADDNFKGRSWLEPMCQPSWAPGYSTRSWYENYGALVNLLFTAGFLGIVKASGAVYSYMEPKLSALADHSFENVQFEIHPAFHQALSIAHTNGMQ